MKFTKRIRAIAVIAAIALAALAGYFYYTATPTVPAYTFKEALPRYQFIESSDQLQKIYLPKNDAVSVITDPQQIVGSYTAVPVAGGQLIQPFTVIPELPDGQKLFVNGKLPEGMDAYPIELPAAVASAISENDLLDIFFVNLGDDGLADPADYALLLLQKQPYLVDTNGAYFLPLTPQQIAIYQDYQAQLEPNYFLVTITQAVNPDYPPLSKFALLANPEDADVKAMFAQGAVLEPMN